MRLLFWIVACATVLVAQSATEPTLDDRNLEIQTLETQLNKARAARTVAEFGPVIVDNVPVTKTVTNTIKRAEQTFAKMNKVLSRVMQLVDAVRPAKCPTAGAAAPAGATTDPSVSLPPVSA